MTRILLMLMILIPVLGNSQTGNKFKLIPVDFGLSCTDYNVPNYGPEKFPRLLKLSISDESMFFYDFGNKFWRRLENFKIFPDRYEANRSVSLIPQNTFIVGRFSSMWHSSTDMNFLSEDGPPNSGDCYRVELDEMDKLIAEKQEELSKYQKF